MAVEKKCYRCKGKKSPLEFGIDRSRPDGRSYICKLCKRMRESEPDRVANRRAWEVANREKLNAGAREWRKTEAYRAYMAAHWKDLALYRAHKLRRTDWEQLLEAQGGCCYLCGDEMAEPVIDHDHRCCPAGKSCSACRRGLACRSCNLVIGNAYDDPERLIKIAYSLRKTLVSLSLPANTASC